LLDAYQHATCCVGRQAPTMSLNLRGADEKGCIGYKKIINSIVCAVELMCSERG
jgi:hypothetical protein